MVIEEPLKSFQETQAFLEHSFDNDLPLPKKGTFQKVAKDKQNMAHQLKNNPNKCSVCETD